MNRQEHLAFCKICTHQKFDANQGIICGLTNAIANFDPICENYEEDLELIEKRKVKRLNSFNGELASTELRFANYLIDRILILVFSVVFGFIMGVVMEILSPGSVAGLEDDDFMLNYFFGFIIGMIYYLLFEGITGRSIGKFVTKTKVVDEKGNEPTFSAIVLRSLCRFIPFDALSYLGSNNIGWHDSLSKTRVVKA